MIEYSINSGFCDKNESKSIIDFCLEYGEPFSYNPSESWDCRRIYDDSFKQEIINRLTEKYTSNEFKLWFNYGDFKLKNFNISLTSYYNGRYLSLHKDKTSELTTVIVLSDGYEGGQFALCKDKNPSFHFETLDSIETFNLKLGDLISFNGSQTYHGVLPVTKGNRFALNIWMTETDFNYPKLKVNNTLL
jgi:Rps23 Pro-64 3,4-dihydroxylase Tpa1-like proline 4-hydroxylase